MNKIWRGLGEAVFSNFEKTEDFPAWAFLIKSSVFSKLKFEKKTLVQAWGWIQTAFNKPAFTSFTFLVFKISIGYLRLNYSHLFKV